MRHSKHKYKLGVDPSHRKSLIRNLAIEVIDHGKIKTTTTKCKAVRGSRGGYYFNGERDHQVFKIHQKP